MVSPLWGVPNQPSKWRTPDMDLLALGFNKKSQICCQVKWSLSLRSGCLGDWVASIQSDLWVFHSSRSFQSSVLGASSPFCFLVTGFNSCPAEVLRDRGLSDMVISTFLKARDSMFHSVYHCKHWVGFACCSARKFHPRKNTVGRILFFL